MISVLDENCACIDTDFLIHISETKCTVNDLLKYLAIAFEKQNLCGVMHPLVYEKELPKDFPVIQEIFKNNIVHVVSLKEIFAGEDGEDRRAYYSFLVPELFKKLNGADLPFINIFNDWKHKCSLGEVHSISLCLTCGCKLFLSDDNDSKRLWRLIESDFGGFEVLTRSDFFNSSKLEGSLPRAIRRQLAHSTV